MSEVNTLDGLYILIENPGVAAPEAFTLLGASNKAGSDAIGQFGSGTKFGVLACLRKGLKPVVYCGNLKLDFGTRPIPFEGGTQDQVTVKFGGKDAAGSAVNRTEFLSVVLRYGEVDWQDKIELALREFVSNALDATRGDASQVKVQIVDTAPRAKAGTTRVYVPVSPEGVAFVNDIGKWFLHFANKVWRETALIHKPTPGPAKIYRRGVLVRQIETGSPSLFDYNLNDLPLDEARVASDWYCKHFAGAALRDCKDVSAIAKVFLRGDECWEGTFDNLTDEYATASQAKVRASVWQEAAVNVIPENAVILHAKEDDSLAVGKGYKVVRVTESVYKAAQAYGLRTTDTILTADEKNGRRLDDETSPETDLAANHVLKVWQKLGQIGATRGEKFPKVRTFCCATEASDGCFGYYRDGTVFINNRGLSADASPELFSTILEELAHYITKATDNSRDFQAFFIQLVTKLLWTN